MNQKQAIQWAAVLGALAVGVGAFGAHVFKPSLIVTGRLETFELAVRYQFYHVFALMVTGILMKQLISKRLHYAALFFIAGILFFCGSLYALCFTGIGMFGAITPIGGVLFILGWIFLLVGVNHD